ncbi:MAG TPA: FUN14 domain-containing protein [Planctomycetota bacterium]|nr:FUN14 domain-containing protein [Planctomycetota bacterium]
MIVLLLGVVVAAVVARAARGTPEARAQEAAQQRSAGGGHGGMTTGLVPGEPQPGGQETTPAPEEKDTLDVVLPFISEGGVAMILGLLLGMVTRSFLKVMFLFVIIGFVGLQYMNYKGVITINWGAMKDFVLNMVPKGASLTQVIQQKLPSLGAFGLGYLLGLKRG